MSSYLNRLVQRHSESNLPVLQPRIPSRFEDVTRSDSTPLGTNAEAAPIPDGSNSNSRDATHDPSRDLHNGGIIVGDFERPNVGQTRDHNSDLDDFWESRFAATQSAINLLSSRERPSGETNIKPGPILAPVALPSHDGLVSKAREAIHIHQHFTENRTVSAPQIPTGDDTRVERSTQSPAVVTPAKTNILLESRTPSPVWKVPEATIPAAVVSPGILNERSDSPAPTNASSSRINDDNTQVGRRFIAPPSIRSEYLPQESAERTTVHVSIGRIEIRSPASKQETKRLPPTPVKSRIMTLDDYAKMRSGGMG